MKLDLGCGANKQQGFIGVDKRQILGVHQWDLIETPWSIDGTPLPDNSVEEVHIKYLVEHLRPEQREVFIHELYRVMKVGAKAQLIAPYWSSTRACGDPTTYWPPVNEFWFLSLDKEVREKNPDLEHFREIYTCDFQTTWGYGLPPHIATRNVEYQQFAIQNYKDAASAIVATLTKR